AVSIPSQTHLAHSSVRLSVLGPIAGASGRPSSPDKDRPSGLMVGERVARLHRPTGLCLPPTSVFVEVREHPDQKSTAGSMCMTASSVHVVVPFHMRKPVIHS